MTTPSRRQLAEYAAKQLLGGTPPKKIARQLAAVLVESRRTKDAELLGKDIAWELERRGKLADADVTTATSLTNELKKELTNFIKSKTGAEDVVLRENIDKDVIGGMRLETSIHSWDKTLRKSLTDIQEAF